MSHRDFKKCAPKIGSFKDHLAIYLLGDPIFKYQEFWFDYLRPEEDHEEEPWDRNETFHNLDGALTKQTKRIQSADGLKKNILSSGTVGMLVFYHVMA